MVLNYGKIKTYYCLFKVMCFSKLTFVIYVIHYINMNIFCHLHKVWQLGSSISNFTLEGHEKGVNCVDYYHGGDKPYLISGADDRLVKIWDYQNKTCVQTLESM